MAELSMSGPNPVVRRDELVERGQRFSEFLAVLESRIVGGAKSGALEAAVPAALVRLLPIRGARLTTAPAPPLAAREGPPVSSLRFPVSVPSHAELALEVTVDPGLALGAWERQALRQAARVVGLLIACRNQAPPSGQVPEPAAPLVGKSAPMRRLRQQIERVAATDFTVLIEGECGSGKELVARQVHELSRRRRGPFVAVNCAALVETLLEAELFGIEDRVATGVRARRGKFELADQGTLFLDEVADLSPAAQAKLLRAIQELSVERVGGHGARAVDIRIVVATNQRLRGLAQEGRFRTDLYYRLRVVTLRVPPLRERTGDIPRLAWSFVEAFAAEHRKRIYRLEPELLDRLVQHPWPGNVRELRNLVEGLVIFCKGDTLRMEDLPPELRIGRPATPPSPEAEPPRFADLNLDTIERQAVLQALERSQGNRQRAAKLLGMGLRTLQKKLKEYGLTARRRQ